ncbi:MAG: gamma-glutamyltransferase [Rhodospirillales bacterium]|nr:gamma-glutamyltransferase [Rhodospirillales bacterium]
MRVSKRPKGAIAAGHPETVRAAQITLEEGGNAFDAVMAAMVASTVCEPVLSSMGGGGFLMACPVGKAPVVYDFFAQTPGTHAPEEGCDFSPVVCDFGPTQQEFHIGRAAIAVPGAIKGLFEVVGDLGRMPVSRVVEPAVALARAGLPVNAMQARIFQVVGPIYMATPESRALFASKKDPARLIGEGEHFANIGFADAMEAIAREGQALFYKGEISAAIDTDCRNGGALRRRDLEAYRIFRRDPLRVAYRGASFITNPPPSSGGILVAFALALLDEATLTKTGFGSSAHLELLAKVMKLTNQARLEAGFSDKGAEDAGQALLDSELLHKYRTSILGVPASRRGTTQISVVDGDGNAAALTISNGEGSGYIVPETGIMLNNMLGEEDINPRGFHQWLADTRMSSMMAPSLLMQSDKRITALGSGGSNRIRTAILQVLINMVDFKMPLQAAVSAPRIHLEGGRLDIEFGFEPAIGDGLARSFEDVKIWDEQNLFFGGVHGVGYEPDTHNLWAAGDERRNGCTAILS